MSLSSVVILSVVAIAFVFSSWLTYVLSRPTSPFKILDLPNTRSLHSSPVPRTGGLAILAGGLAAIAVVLVLQGCRIELFWIGGAVLVVAVVSFIDDHSHVSIWVRLTFHAIAAGCLLAAGLNLTLVSFLGFEFVPNSFVESILGALFVVWMINLYNFMDGMDGFAGGMALFGFGTLGWIGFAEGDPYFASVAWSIAAAAAGFLVWNFPPARIFMGDTGASTLGVMAAALSLWGEKLGLFPLWIAMLVFSPFIVDATVTLLARVARREPFWDAHRHHYYQRLVQTGWGHRKTVLVEYGLMVGCGVTAVALTRSSAAVQWAGIGTWITVYLVGMHAVAKLHSTAR